MAQESFKCPDDFGFYPHDLSCDKYWKCDNNVAELKTCGNGLAFDASDSKFLTENCDYLHNVDCGDRTQLGKASYLFQTLSVQIIIDQILIYIDFYCLQNNLSLLLTAPVCTASSLMKTNVMSSGTVGTVKHLDINAHLVWLTIVKLVCACGQIKFQNAETKVKFTVLIS